jgi:uncharacterized protein
MSSSSPSRPASRLLRRYGPWAVVTGASSGIGRELARQAAAAGLDVVLVARRRDELQALADELAGRHGVRAEVVAADLSRPGGVGAVVAATGSLDVGLLVAAAGRGTSGDFLDADLADEVGMLEVNCGAVLALAHHFGGRFAERGRGGIVLLSSIVAYQGTPRAAHYAATKAYVHTLAEGLRAELRPRGVDVLASAPGPVHSGFADRAGMTMGRALAPADVAAATLAALGRRSVVAPGALSKVLTSSLAPLPRRARVAIMGRVMGGMTRDRVAAGPPQDAPA